MQFEQVELTCMNDFILQKNSVRQLIFAILNSRLWGYGRKIEHTKIGFICYR